MYYTGSFIKGPSLIYNLDPRLKLAATVFLSVFILWVNPPITFVIGIVLFCAALVSGIRLRTIWQAINPLLFFIVMIFLVHVFFNQSKGGTPTTNPFFELSFSCMGLQQGVFVVWRFLCLIVAAVLLTMTTAPSQMIAAMKYFLKPLKKLRAPVDDIAMMIMLALRLMPILLAQKERIETAQRARGFDPRQSGFVVRIKSFFSLISKVLLGVFRRADELTLAMEARNYQRGDRASFVELKFKSVDYLTFILFVFSLFIFVALNSHFS